MKDANGREIKIGDKIQRKDVFCYGKDCDGDPLINPPPPGAIVADMTGCAVVTRHGVYVGRMLEVL